MKQKALRREVLDIYSRQAHESLGYILGRELPAQLAARDDYAESLYAVQRAAMMLAVANIEVSFSTMKLSGDETEWGEILWRVRLSAPNGYRKINAVERVGDSLGVTFCEALAVWSDYLRGRGREDVG